MQPSGVIVVMALEIEAQTHFEARGVNVLFTGIGKVNAAHKLTRRLVQATTNPSLVGFQGSHKPLVVNFGTAGSRRHPAGALVACRKFVQRDMDVTGLGFAAGETPFEDVPPELEFPAVFRELPHGVCASADRFETLDHATPWDIVDMEAYALAKVCWLEGVPFACAKFVTDGANASAANDWESNLPRAASEFLRLYEQLVETNGTRSR